MSTTITSEGPASTRPGLRRAPRAAYVAAWLTAVASLLLVVASLVLVQAPGDIADVPRRTRAEQPPLLDRQLLHPCDDLRSGSHG